jgi:hypothetical protein
MGLIRTVLFIIATFEVLKVNGQLSYSSLSSSLLYSYFKCKFPTTTIDDTFFNNNVLSRYTNSSSAMSFIQSVYNDISTTQSIFGCVNANYNIYLYITTIYSPYFLNLAYYNDLVKILSDFRSSHGGISFQQFELQYAFSGVQSPNLDSFSYNYDYTYDILFLYPMAVSCATNSQSYSSCILQIQTPFNASTWQSYASNITKCAAQAMSSCDQSTKRLLMFEILANIRTTYNIQTLPNGLISYIDSLLPSSGLSSTGVLFTPYVILISLFNLIFIRLINF